MSFGEQRYQLWRNNRLKFATDSLNIDFSGTTVLELGAGRGDLGNDIFNKGAKSVVCLEGRDRNVAEGKNLYPHLYFEVKDLNQPWTLEPNSFDIIVHFGVFYHLDLDDQELYSHMSGVIASAKNLVLFETEVFDSKDEVIIRVQEPDQYDQSLTSRGVRPSRLWVEKMFQVIGVEYEHFASPLLNSQTHIYDWIEKDDKKWTQGYRRFWVLKK